MVKNKLFILLFLILCGQSIFAGRPGGYSDQTKQVDVDFKNAIYKKDFEDAKKALKKGADINTRDRSNATVLIRKVQDNDKVAVEFLLNKKLHGKIVDINAQDGNQRTALMSAASNCNQEILQMLLNNNADISIQARFGVTALTIVIENGCSPEIALALLKKGAQIDYNKISTSSNFRDAFSIFYSKATPEIKKLVDDQNSVNQGK